MNISNSTSHHFSNNSSSFTHIRALFFDLDGTLRHDHPSSHETFFDFAVQLGAPDLPHNRPQALRWAHGYWANVDQLAEQDLVQYGRITPEFWQNYARRYLIAYGCDGEQAHALSSPVHTQMAERHTPTNILAPDVHPTLSTLKKDGYTLGLITNRSRPCLEELETLGIVHYFDLILTAGEVNSFKPDPAIFEHALTRTGVQPQTAFYVGDNYYADIIGAERVGMIPILLDPERIFSDVPCTVIDTLSELLSLLNHG